jgi:excisionase family DNA binding protein
MKTKQLSGSTDADIMTVHDVAGYLRLSEAKVYKMAQESDLPAFRLGKSWRFRKAQIDEWIRKATIESLKLFK